MYGNVGFANFRGSQLCGCSAGKARFGPKVQCVGCQTALRLVIVGQKSGWTWVKISDLFILIFIDVDWFCTIGDLQFGTQNYQSWCMTWWCIEFRTVAPGLDPVVVRHGVGWLFVLPEFSSNLCLERGLDSRELGIWSFSTFSLQHQKDFTSRKTVMKLVADAIARALLAWDEH